MGKLDGGTSALSQVHLPRKAFDVPSYGARVA
jgi:hypothetical protein